MVEGMRSVCRFPLAKESVFRSSGLPIETVIFPASNVKNCSLDCKTKKLLKLCNHWGKNNAYINSGVLDCMQFSRSSFCVIIWEHTWAAESERGSKPGRVTVTGLLPMLSNFSWLWEADGKVGSVFWKLVQSRNEHLSVLWTPRVLVHLTVYKETNTVTVFYLHQFEAEPQQRRRKL